MSIIHGMVKILLRHPGYKIAINIFIFGYDVARVQTQHVYAPANFS